MLAHLADVSVRWLLLGLAAELAVRMRGRGRTAAWEHAVWTAVVCAGLALLAAGGSLPKLSVRTPARREWAGMAALRTQPAARSIAADSRAAAAAVAAAARRRFDWRNFDWRDAATGLYCAVAAVFLVQFAIGMLLLWRLLASASETGREGVYESGLIATPFAAGWLKPRIVLPLEWREWDSGKLAAVLEHEGAHVRRRDGLVAALACVNRCLFWFHPLAWLAERKIARLAERSCDEWCVAALGDRRSYAQVLLEMAQVVDSSTGRLRRHALTMAAGPHLRQRIEALLEEGRTFSRGLTRRAWAALALCGLPLVWVAGALELQAQAQPPARVSFEVASVKQSVPGPPTGAGGRGGGPAGGACPESLRIDAGRVDFECAGMLELIAYAFRIQSGRITGPPWLPDRRTRWDIQATLAKGASERAVPEMFQSLLADRFHLEAHRATSEQAVFALTVMKGGLKMKEGAAPPETPADADAPAPTITELGGIETMMTHTRDSHGSDITVRTNPRIGVVRETMFSDARQRWEMQGMSMEGFADLLDRVAPLSAEVIDRTEIKGRYDGTLEVSVAEAFAELKAIRESMGQEESNLHMDDAMLKALNNGLGKLGLQLERRKAPIEMLVIDRLERMPTAN